MKTPKRAAKKLFFLSNPSSTAKKHPVHAPLPGNGTATNSIIPKYPYFSIELFFFNVFSLNRVMSCPNFLNLIKNSSTASIKKSTNGMMSMLATIHTMKAQSGSISNKEAAINPPRSSKIGINDIMKMSAYFPNKLPVIPPNTPKMLLTSLLAIDNLLCQFVYILTYILDTASLAFYSTRHIFEPEKVVHFQVCSLRCFYVFIVLLYFI